MSGHNRVIWSEGLFLQPQHFQQQDRYFERYVETRCQPLMPHSWGFTEIEFERDFLRIGKFGLRRLAGVFPDGTPFRMPDDDPLPPPIDVGPEVRDQRLLPGGSAAPRRRAGRRRDARRQTTSCGTTFASLQAANAAVSGGDPATLEVGALRTRLLLAARRHRRLRLHAARARRRMPGRPAGRARRAVHPDGPAAAGGDAAGDALTTELLGLLHQRGEALAGRVAATGRGAAAEFADFLMLQAINRYEPLLAHYADSGVIHPEALFQFCVAAAGELATFTTTSKRPPKFPGYRHDHLQEIVRAGDRVAARVAEQGDDPDRHSDPARAEEIRHQRRHRARSSRCSAPRCSSLPRAPMVPRNTCGSGSRRRSRSARRRKSAIWCVRGFRACRWCRCR